jgi:hypothetical protein
MLAKRDAYFGSQELIVPPLFSVGRIIDTNYARAYL